jgi:hypothetical protein
MCQKMQNEDNPSSKSMGQATQVGHASHNNEDKPAIEQVAHRLRQQGIEPWLDKWNLKPGTPWQPAIEDASAPPSDR